MKKRMVFCITLPTLLSGTPAEAQNIYNITLSQKNKLLNETHLDLTLRNHWKHLKENEAQPTAVHNAWGQAANVNLQSGYLWNVIGVDATWTRAVRVGASDYFSTRGLLYNQGEGIESSNLAESYQQVAERMTSIIMQIARDAREQGGGNVLVVSHGMAVIKGAGRYHA
ncbi:histidine phosphatase family protein [Erwinia psidii]|uniref:histidine phosphatase family protein n=1 Tax=Erwinia psidii TaxID=69224 RepID=UPI001F391CA6|nr:histidine phosphatase family protein [Erwinia psidii]